MFESIKTVIDKENGALSLVKQSKLGIINSSNQERLSAKLYVYEAFKSILQANNISKKDYLANIKQESSFRQGYISIMSIYLKNKDSYQSIFPELYESKAGINVDAFTKLLQQINEEWLQIQKEIKENTVELQTMKKLKDKVSYSTFVTITEEQRRKLLQIAKDRNRTEDVKVYQQLQKYITEKEKITKEDYLNRPEIREKYREEHQKLRQELGERPKLRASTLEENMSYIINNWYLIAVNKSFVSEESRNQFISQYNIVDFAHLSIKEMEDLYYECDKELHESIKKRQEEILKWEETSRQNQAVTDQIYNDFIARYVTETAEAYRKIKEREEMLSEAINEKSSTSVTDTSKK